MLFEEVPNGISGNKLASGLANNEFGERAFRAGPDMSVLRKSGEDDLKKYFDSIAVYDSSLKNEVQLSSDRQDLTEAQRKAFDWIDSVVHYGKEPRPKLYKYALYKAKPGGSSILKSLAARGRYHINAKITYVDFFVISADLACPQYRGVIELTEKGAVLVFFGPDAGGGVIAILPQGKAIVQFNSQRKRKNQVERKKASVAGRLAFDPGNNYDSAATVPRSLRIL